jgi:uncharacterized phage protein (TIGR01671 family)
MTRLFRGKRKDSGDWAIGYYSKKLYPERHFITYWTCNETVEVIPETVGQSTGLEDKNGKEIFEGDIIRVKDKMENTLNDCKVIFESGSYKAVPLEDGDLAYIMFFASQNGEIIGNIHEEAHKVYTNQEGDEN